MQRHSTYDEKQLLEEIAAGDEQAFELLFMQNRKKVYHYLLQLTKFPEIAEELTMDIFLKLWVGRDLLPVINNLDAFLFKVAHNKALDFFRIASRQHRLHQAYKDHIEHLHNTGQYLPIDQVNLELLSTVINDLPPRRKLIYKLSREENMTYEQIAKHLNLSHKTVKNTMLSALKDIRHGLGSKLQNKDFILLLFFTC